MESLILFIGMILCLISISIYFHIKKLIVLTELTKSNLENQIKPQIHILEKCVRPNIESIEPIKSEANKPVKIETKKTENKDFAKGYTPEVRKQMSITHLKRWQDIREKTATEKLGKRKPLTEEQKQRRKKTDKSRRERKKMERQNQSDAPITIRLLDQPS